MGISESQHPYSSSSIQLSPLLTTAMHSPVLRDLLAFAFSLIGTQIDIFLTKKNGWELLYFFQ